MLNKKTEFVAKCRHERKFMLEQVKDKKGERHNTDEIKVKECQISLGRKSDCLKNQLLSPNSKLLARCTTHEPYVRLTRINLHEHSEYTPHETLSQKRTRISNRKYYNEEFIT